MRVVDREFRIGDLSLGGVFIYYKEPEVNSFSLRTLVGIYYPRRIKKWQKPGQFIGYIFVNKHHSAVDKLIKRESRSNGE